MGEQTKAPEDEPLLDTPEKLWQFATDRDGELRAVARSVTYEPAVIEDAVQHAKVYADTVPWPEPGRAFGVLSRMVRNCCVDHLRARGPARGVAVLAATERTVESDPAVLVTDRHDLDHRLRLAKSWLTLREWTAFVMRAEGASYTEIAEHLGISTDGVETMLLRARKKCRRRRAATQWGIGGSAWSWCRTRRRRFLGAAPLPVAAALLVIGATVAPLIGDLPWFAGRSDPVASSQRYVHISESGPEARSSADSAFDRDAQPVAFAAHAPGSDGPTPDERGVRVEAPSLAPSGVVAVNVPKLDRATGSVVMSRSHDGDTDTSMSEELERCARGAVAAVPMLPTGGCAF